MGNSLAAYPTLRQLCFALGLKYDDLRGEGCAHKARELVSLVERQRQLPQLSTALRQARPELYARANLSSAAAALHALCPPAPPLPRTPLSAARRRCAN
jgi:hypothetical protein